MLITTAAAAQVPATAVYVDRGGGKEERSEGWRGRWGRGACERGSPELSKRPNNQAFHMEDQTVGPVRDRRVGYDAHPHREHVGAASITP